ncbi:hypothetical protein [Herbiconiux sp. YIM B11900]|uniref:hypothetical protein n=1 Tax=Herbiconiux sp. YIM B11900 TaxID=3404131 RepID=UPI003F87CFF8
MTNRELAELVEQLRAENEELRAAVRADAQAEADAAGVDAPDGAAPRGTRRRGRQRGRTVASVVLVVIGLVLAPLALAGSWAQGQLADTNQFVATYGPLAQDPAVKAFLVDEVMTVVNEQVDFPQSTSDVFGAVSDLGLPPRAAAALQALERPAALGLQSLATSVVTQFIDSQAFEDIWAQTLRLTHQQLIAAMTNDPTSALRISSTGELTIQLGPVIDAVKGAMVAQGLAFADAIPSVDVGVTVAKSSSLSQLTLIYGLSVSIGQWLPLVALLFLVAGVVVAKRRTVTLFWTGLALGVVMVLLGIALRVGQVIVVASTAQYVPGPAMAAIYDGVTSLIASSIVALAVLGFTVMLISWALGPWRPAPAVRSAFVEGANRLRRAGDRRGISTGSFGRFLGRQRVLTQVLIGLGAAALIVFIRPLSTAQIIWTAVVALLLLLVVEVLQRPPLPAIVVLDDDLSGSSDDEQPDTADRVELRG